MQAVSDVEIVRESVDLAHLRVLAEDKFGDLVKAVVDVDRGIMAIGGDMHADEESALLEDGSVQGAVWGINLYPSNYGTDAWLEFDSIINYRPRQANVSRAVESPEVRERIAAIVERLVQG
jgi:Protein of unknown function (DUF5674)